jgi:two-component system KDP operon response regulator KdpE
LPDRDGLELIQPIRARTSAPIIIASARDQTGEKVTALDLGADDYVVKPFDTEELLARLRAAFRHKEGEAGARPLTAGGVEIDLEHRRVRNMTCWRSWRASPTG